MHSEKHTLKPTIGLFTAVTIIVGTIIGSGVFVKPSSVLAYAGTSNMALWAWIIGGVLTLASGLTIAEVGAQITRTGGLYAYIKDIYGSFWGFLTGYTLTVLYGPAIIVSLILFLGILITNFFVLSQIWIIPIGAGIFLFLLVTNMIGTYYANAVQNVTTLAKLIPIIAIVTFGLIYGQSGIFGQNVTELILNKDGTVNFGRAVLATLFAYDGWILLTTMSGEMKNPQKHLPLAMFIGILTVTLVYVLINVAIFKILPAADILNFGNNVSAEAAMVLFGGIGAKIVNIGLIVSIIGTLNGKVMTFPRIPFAMAQDGLLPGSKGIKYISPRFETPIGAHAVMSILTFIILTLSIIFPSVFDADYLSEITIFIIYFFYMAAFIGLFILRRQNKGKPRAFSVPFYPVLPILALFGGLFIIINTLISDPLGAGIAVMGLLMGIPLYWYTVRNKMKQL
ncbi:APC family permease [Staphylococcus hyicus]|uniref:APC family permease n=1 Tax=Staphylococcus hyicus TaxID=1284 RepID=UPI00208F4F2C|nr:amino acid permease [Staphylococcus hyicus]MCO4329083.1 amino acid permease [Staphylococcus hyicus]MCO4331656.1 amino acid permease [Staphylococcus hyicus]MCO4334865.1 amino acid permease [Staphylococcus hyicus]MCO4335382.1 amino acid permease [Staphylococcus hyicus]